MASGSDSSKRPSTLPRCTASRSSNANRDRFGATCDERAHYPIFNPSDPRHNPSWTGEESQHQEPSNESTASWMRSLPMRSLRKARSGFLALKSGIQSRKGPRRGMSNTGVSSNLGNSFPSTISEGSTEEDHDTRSNLHLLRCWCHANGHHPARHTWDSAKTFRN
ncbi:hypothetical protein BJX96DRAFT_44590 [Aspergillus floccosus]